MNSNKDLFLHFGIKSIDAQHQKFYGLLNELRIYNLNGDDNEAVRDIIEELKAYSVYHFEMEKRIMTRSGFDGIAAHLEQHDLFIKKIDEFIMAYKYQSASLSDQMLVFLQKWFLVHIPEWDSKYVEHIHKK